MPYVVNVVLAILFWCAVAYTQRTADKFFARKYTVTFSKGRE
jgi:hypothetical protein